MGCRVIQPELIAFHFGDVEPAVRAEVEAHLLSCSSCLRDYLALKRELEMARAEEVPSPGSRARLRAAVAVELGIEPRWSWWARPLALASAAASLAVAIFAVNLLARSPGLPPHASPDVGQADDGARENSAR